VQKWVGLESPLVLSVDFFVFCRLCFSLIRKLLKSLHQKGEVLWGNRKKQFFFIGCSRGAHCNKTKNGLLQDYRGNNPITPESPPGAVLPLGLFCFSFLFVGDSFRTSGFRLTKQTPYISRVRVRGFNAPRSFLVSFKTFMFKESRKLSYKVIKTCWLRTQGVSLQFWYQSLTRQVL